MAQTIRIGTLAISGSVTTNPGQNLVLSTASFGASITIASASGIPTFATGIVVTSSVAAAAATDLVLAPGSGGNNSVQVNLPGSGQFFLNAISNNASLVFNRTGSSAGSATISGLNSGGIQIAANLGAVAGTWSSVMPGTSTSTSGQNYSFSVIPTYNQASGSAANTDFLVNRIQTSVGSGIQRLIDAQVGGVTKFNVDNQGNGTFAANLTVQGNIFNPSDSRIKTSVEDSGLGLSFILGLRPVSYQLSASPGETHHGLIAQEVEAALAGRAFSGLHRDATTDHYSLSYTQFVAPLIRAVQELNQEVATLRARVAGLGTT